MKKFYSALALSVFAPCLMAQSVPAAYSISQHDLRGTARFMSMAGAFGALGGDISVLSQNPGGIGVYRSNDISFTLGLDTYNSKSDLQDGSESTRNTSFVLDNIGGVFTMRLNNSIMPNINFGVSYNKTASFDRRYKGTFANLQTSLSNYIAGVSNNAGLNEADVSYGDNYDPYNPPVGNRNVPWISVLGYYGFLTNPEGDPENPHWEGQFGDGTKGSGTFNVREKGSVDEFNIAFGGNINNKVFWGMDFGITSLDYRITSEWSESLENAYVYDPNKERVGRYSADWTLHDHYKLNGTGFNFKLGFIVKPIQQLRIGFAFHTPTYYNLNETYSDEYINYTYPFKTKYNSDVANNGIPAVNDLSFTTPWRLIASVAGVIGQKFIISADYEWAGYRSMKYSEANYGYYDPWWDWDNPWNGWGDWYYAPSKTKSSASSASPRYAYSNPNDYANANIKEIYKHTNTLRIGAEYRVLPSFSVRAGYSISSSPVTTKARDNRIEVPGTGILTGYSLDDQTNYLTLGVGFRNKGFYADLAYVYRHFSSEYHPFAIDITAPQVCPQAKIAFNNSNVALTLGYKF